jgi:hypothetical protein
LTLGPGKNQTLLCRISEITPFLKALNDNKRSDGLGVTRGSQRNVRLVPAASDIGRVSLTITIGDGNGDHPQGPVCQVVGALIEGISWGFDRRGRERVSREP